MIVLIVIGYVVAGLITARIAAPALADDLGGALDGGDKAMVAAMAFFAGAFWPAVALIALVYWFVLAPALRRRDQ